MNRLEGRTILVVDDEPDLMNVTAEILELEGARALRATGGHAALELLAREPVDAILSDVRMPAGTGLDLLRGISRCMPVTLITGYAELSIEEAYDLGAQAILAKPSDFATITDQVVRMLVPREQRWRAPVAPAALAVEPDTGRLSLGSHGIFVGQDGPLPKLNADVRLRLNFGADQTPLEVQGITRWRRPASDMDLPPGFGVEITSMPPERIAPWLAELERLAPRAYIPRR